MNETTPEVFITEDHPEANGRRPQVGDRQYVMSFTLADGRKIVVKMGGRRWQHVSDGVRRPVGRWDLFGLCAIWSAVGVLATGAVFVRRPADFIVLSLIAVTATFTTLRFLSKYQ